MERSRERELRKVSKLQAQEHDRDESPNPTARVYVAAPRLLEESPGVWRLYKLKRVIASAEGVRVDALSLKRGTVGVTRYMVDRLYWDHAYGLLQLQGAGPRDLIGPNYLILRARRGRVTDPRPHLRDLVMASVHAVPKDMKLLDLFGELQRLLV